MSLYIFNFDGTTNSPKDAFDEKKDTITNIVKLHLIFGGAFIENGESSFLEQKSFYYSGVGTYGESLNRMFNSILSPEEGDVKNILNRALNDFKSIGFNSEKDKVVVTGFSRGAALARRFATIVGEKIDKASLYIIAFDTVASIGVPDFNMGNRPSSEVVFENHRVSGKVIKALHIVALDEKRKAFQPTLMNYEEKVTEVWFPGAHADIGGGYRQDGLADNVLCFALRWLAVQNLGVQVKSISDIDYQNIFPIGSVYKIKKEDLNITPNPLCASHEQKRNFILSWFTLSRRRCCVVKDDLISTIPPNIHDSVFYRIKNIKSYKPNIPNQLEDAGVIT
ncbi:phospholipase effector Tle1 domain-containing protein [Vibrio owensii]